MDKQYEQIINSFKNALLANDINNVDKMIKPFVEVYEKLAKGHDFSVVKSCVNRFVETEFDTLASGDRGIGRASSDTPRLGGFYRKDLEGLGEEKLKDLRQLILELILTSYLFALLNLNGEVLIFDKEKETSLYEQWIPKIYITDLSGGLGEAMYDLLMTSVEQPAKQLIGFFDDNDFSKPFFGEDKKKKIVFGYILAGFSLRMTEIELG